MILDIITLALLLVFIFWGTKRGAMKMLLSIVSYGAAIAAGFLFYRPIAELLNTMGITEGLAHKLEQNAAAMLLPGVMRDLPFMAESAGEMAMSAASAAVSAVSFIAAAVLVRLVLFVISAVLGIAGSLPIIRQANGLVGGIAGWGVGVLIELIAFGILAVFEVFGKTGTAAQLMEGSQIAMLIYNNNPLLSFVAAP